MGLYGTLIKGVATVGTGSHYNALHPLEKTLTWNEEQRGIRYTKAQKKHVYLLALHACLKVRIKKLSYSWIQPFLARCPKTYEFVQYRWLMPHDGTLNYVFT